MQKRGLAGPAFEGAEVTGFILKDQACLIAFAAEPALENVRSTMNGNIFFVL